MSKTPYSSMVMFFVAAFFGALGQFFYKSGADKASSGMASYFLNMRLALGVLCYVIVMFLFVAAFKRGGSMATLYPIYATTFIWGAIISYVAFGSEISFVNIAGMFVMALGMYLLGV